MSPSLQHIGSGVITTVTAAGLACSASAQEQSQLELRTGVVFATNPFQSINDDADSFAVSVEAIPQVTWETERTAVTFDGRLRYEEWLEDYDSDLFALARLSLTNQASETLELFGSASFETTERALAGLSTDSLDPTVPTLPGANDLADDAIFGAGIRRDTAAASFGGQKSLSATQAIRAEGSSQFNWFGEGGFDYRTLQFDLQYLQNVSPTVEWTIGGQVAQSDFFGQERGDGVFAGVMTGARIQVSPTGSLGASAGVAFASVDTGIEGAKDKGEYFIASFDYCEELIRGQLCAVASRESRPTTIGGASIVNSAGLSWNRTFDEGESFSLNARYGDTKASLAAFDLEELQETSFVAASAYYATPITERLGLYVAPSALLLLDNPFDRGDNYQISVGLSYRFGRQR